MNQKRNKFNVKGRNFLIIIVAVVVLFVAFSFSADDSWVVKEKDLDIYYVELMKKEQSTLDHSVLEQRYYFIVEIRAEDSQDANDVKQGTYRIEVTKAAYSKYGIDSILKAYFDANQQMHLPEISKSQPYNDIKAH